VSLLDTDVITERCRALGMSPIALARALGVSTVAIRSLEQGANHSNLTLHRVERLAHALGLPINALFPVDDRPENSTATALELKVEAALAIVGKKVDPDDLATALNCTLDDVHAACKALQRRRAGSALRPYYSGGQWGLAVNRTLLTKQQITDLERAFTTRNRITVNEAVLLKRIIDSEAGFKADELTHAQRPLLARFLRLGWVERLNSQYVITDDVRAALGLPPHA
jgi:transcriptional regulator with XRE-family HTH domain